MRPHPIPSVPSWCKVGLTCYFNPLAKIILLTSLTSNPKFNIYFYNVNNTDEENAEHGVDKANVEKYIPFDPDLVYIVGKRVGKIFMVPLTAYILYTGKHIRTIPYQKEMLSEETTETPQYISNKKNKNNKNENL